MPGRLFQMRLKLKLRDELDGGKLTRRKINRLLDSVDEDAIEYAIHKAGAAEAVAELESRVEAAQAEALAGGTAVGAGMAGAFGDGTWIKMFFEFWKGDFGQAIIKIIMGLLL